MKVKVTSKNKEGNWTWDVRDESSLWGKIGLLIEKADIPEVFEILTEDGKYSAIRLENSGPKIEKNNIYLPRSCYTPKYLQKVDVSTNAYYFYRMIPHTMGKKTFSYGGSFGRIGAGENDLDAEKIIREPEKSFMFLPKYHWLIRQGYVDKTEVMMDDRQMDDIRDLLSEHGAETLINEGDSMEDLTALNLYTVLQEAAKNTISENMDVDFCSEKPLFTKRQVTASRKLWEKLGDESNIDKFNEILLELLGLTPRKVDRHRGQTLKALLAKEKPSPEEQKREFARIIDREEEIIMAIEAMTDFSKHREKREEKKSPFGNVEIREASPDKKAFVMGCIDSKNYLGINLAQKVRKVYEIRPVAQESLFNEYCEEHNIKTKKYLWHGSATGNWLSIVKNSLSKTPNATFHGNMFGTEPAIYAAPSSSKSWGYTSYSGSRWEHGQSRSAFMGLFETAYGNPYIPTQHVRTNRKELEEMGCNCLHAKGGSGAGVLNDEVVFFSEEALCLRYLVEFGDGD